MNNRINIDSQALQGLGNGQRVLIVADGPERAAVGRLDSIAAEAERHGLRVTVKRSNGQCRISLPEDSGAPRRGGSIEILTKFQARNYGAFRGRVVDQLLHPFEQLPEEAIPCLITGSGIAFNYYTGAAQTPPNVPVPAYLQAERDLLAAVVLTLGSGQVKIPRTVLDTLPRDYSLQVSEDKQDGGITVGVFPE